MAQVQDGLLQLKHIGNGFTVDEAAEKIHVAAMGNSSVNAEVKNVVELNFESYSAGTNLLIATWTFQKQYVAPYLTQMADADLGMANGSPVVYFYDITPTSAKIVIASGVLNTLKNLNRRVHLRVVEGDSNKGAGGSGGAVDAETVREKLVENIVEFEDFGMFLDAWGNPLEKLGDVQVDFTRYPIDKVARIKGTNWFVFGSSKLS